MVPSAGAESRASGERSATVTLARWALLGLSTVAILLGRCLSGPEPAPLRWLPNPTAAALDPGDRLRNSKGPAPAEPHPDGPCVAEPPFAAAPKLRPRARPGPSESAVL